MQGVLTILTAAELDAAKIGGLPCGWGVPLGQGKKQVEPPHPVLAGDDRAPCRRSRRLRGRRDSRSGARRRGGDRRSTYAPLPHITNLEQSVAPGAPQIWPEAKNNLCYDWAVGDAAATDQAFARAAHVTTVKLINNRVHASPMETRGTIGHYDPSTERYTLYTSNQNPHIIRVLLSVATLGVSEDKIRVVAPDVGGGFGMKIYHYAEELLVVFASKQDPPPGQMDLRPQRGLSLRHPCARPRHHRLRRLRAQTAR